MQHNVLILDFGSQYTQLIARRVRELNIYCEIHPFNKIPSDSDSFKAVVLSGSPNSVRGEDVLHPDLSCDNLVPKELLTIASSYIKVMEQSVNKTAVKKITQYANEYSEIVNDLNIQEEDIKFKNAVLLTKEEIQENPVAITKVFTEGTKKIGYLLYNQFAKNYDSQLNAAFSNFKSESPNSYLFVP